MPHSIERAIALLRIMDHEASLVEATPTALQLCYRCGTDKRLWLAAVSVSFLTLCAAASNNNNNN